MMKKILILLSFCGIAMQLQAQKSYNSKLADSLGADEYGMKKYVFVLLSTGPNTNTDKEFISKQFKSHMLNIEKMAKENKLMVAGPYGKNEHQYRGLFILNTADTMVAEEWLKGDAAIQSGLLKATYIPWYGSAALPMYLPFTEQIQKQKP